jgi:hypothetical protein
MHPRTIFLSVFVVVAAPASWARSSAAEAGSTNGAAADAATDGAADGAAGSSGEASDGPTTATDAGGAASLSAASDDDAAAAPALGPVLGHGAMPGGQLVAAALITPPGQVGLATSAAFGFRKELLGADHRFYRGAGSLAVAYSPSSMFTVGLAVDGRYDRHYGLRPSGEDGYVGDPRLLLRFARPLGKGGTSLGLEAHVWLPGNDAPSVDFGATTVDARALASFAAGPATLSVNAGYRLDRSAESVSQPEKLSVQDQVSLGVGEFDAALAGAMVQLPLGRAFVGLELGADLFVGDGAPDPTLRGLVSGGLRLSPAISLMAFAQYAQVGEPSQKQISELMDVPLIAYEPLLTFGLGLEGRFGGGGGRRKPVTPYVVTDTPRGTPPVAVAAQAAVSGTVLDDAGAPVVGAKVTVTTDKKTGTAVTDARGKYKVAELSVGPAKLDFEVAGKKPQQLTMTLVEGANPAPQVALDPVLPPGELRGNVRSRAGSRAIAGAKIVVTPGDFTATSGADGTFALTLPPGTYTMTTTAEGFAPQVIEAVVDQEGVTVKFVNLDKK